jgi:hypothetical protein
MQAASTLKITQQTKYRHGNGHTTALASISEDENAPEHALQLPTPRITPQPEATSNVPIISDTLFDSPEALPDSGDNVHNKTYTSPSGNPMLTVVDWNCIFDLEVVFCICSNQNNKEKQLLHSGLFPSTFKITKSAFTFSVLDDFLKDNLECKTTAQQYYSKLQSMTSRMFPHLVLVGYICFHLRMGTYEGLQNLYRQLLRASRQWRDLKNRMQQGLGLELEHSAADGALAIFCPACPQPGINLPDDWMVRYKVYVSTSGSDGTCHLAPSRNQLVHTFIMDGNFSTEHMRHRSGEQDIALSAGMAFMANPESYNAHLCTGKEMTQVCEASSLDCSTYYRSRLAPVIPTRQLNRQIQAGHTLTSWVLEQRPATMDFLF